MFSSLDVGLSGVISLPCTYVGTLSASSPAGDSFKKITMIQRKSCQQAFISSDCGPHRKRNGAKNTQDKSRYGKTALYSHGERL